MSNKPERVFKSGNIEAAIWRTQAQQGDRQVGRYSIRIQKQYFDKQSDEWKTTSCLFPEDLPSLERLARIISDDLLITERSQHE